MHYDDNVNMICVVPSIFHERPVRGPGGRDRDWWNFKSSPYVAFKDGARKLAATHSTAVRERVRCVEQVGEVAIRSQLLRAGNRTAARRLSFPPQQYIVTTALFLAGSHSYYRGESTVENVRILSGLAGASSTASA